MKEVEYCEKGFYNNKSRPPENISKGILQGIVLEGSLEEGLESVAIIEQKDGTYIYKDIRCVKLLNPTKTEEASKKFKNYEKALYVCKSLNKHFPKDKEIDGFLHPKLIKIIEVCREIESE